MVPSGTPVVAETSGILPRTSHVLTTSKRFASDHHSPSLCRESLIIGSQLGNRTPHTVFWRHCRHLGTWPAFVGGPSGLQVSTFPARPGSYRAFELLVL